jgi:Zn-dependent peptidase ImmA (M78 family)/transcriptional regulator with XRE-family HTH domain
MNRQFNEEMLSLARLYAGLTQKQLANEAGFSQGTISKFESGLLVPDEQQIAELASACNVLPNFFYRNYNRPLGHLDEGLYRKISMNKSNIQYIQSVYKMYALEIDVLMRSVDFSNLLPLPQLQCGGPDGITPATVASIIRNKWGLKGPINNLSLCIERAGIIVIPMYDLPDEIDGVTFKSVWNYKNLMLINMNMPADRVRFTMAHELGHMIMHYGNSFNDEKIIEDEANEFAAEFLAPSDEIKPFLYDLKLDQNIFILKSHWKISIAALVKRAKDLDIISDTKYKNLNISISKNGWRKSEPIQIPVEEPTALRDIIKAHIDLGYSEDDLAKALRLTKVLFLHRYKDFLPYSGPRIVPKLVRNHRVDKNNESEIEDSADFLEYN